jgi:hypothetical protein
VRWILVLLSMLSASTVYTTGHAESIAPAPFTATFLAEYRGIEGGTLTFTFAHEADDRYSYETHVNPGLLARFFVSASAVERSVMTIDANGVHPQNWKVDDGKPGNKEDGELQFDWAGGHVRGTIKGKPVDLAAESGLQDRISVQIAVMTALVRGVDPGTIPMVDDDHIKYYQYKKTRSETIDTKMGKIETVVYEGTRENSNRVSRFWLAPSMGYAPIRAEQERKGKVETVMTLVELKR